MDKEFLERISKTPKSSPVKRTSTPNESPKQSPPYKRYSNCSRSNSDFTDLSYTSTKSFETKEENSEKYLELLKNEILPNSPNRVLSFDSTIPKTTTNLSQSPNTNSPLKKPTRKIHSAPFKILDAPQLQDDFYLNLVDWSSSNILAVGLGDTVYLWNASTAKVTTVCTLEDDNMVTSISWNQNGRNLAVGDNNGKVKIWDVEKVSCLKEYSSHSQRVSSLSWNKNMFSSGSRDKTIVNHDSRMESISSTFKGHKQEVCGLKWSPDGSNLASGGNDNKLMIWNLMNTSSPLHKFSDHNAAVKALCWSPHQSGLLASGGGTADKKIRFWNTLSGQCINTIDTGSQVCNIAWSKNVNELVSTHGFSQNQIIVWKYPTMKPIATLTGHTYRVLYLSISPDGTTIVTGAGDQTLRFWNVFPQPKFRDFENTKLRLEIR